MNVDVTGEFRTSLQRLKEKLHQDGTLQKQLLARGVTLVAVEDALRRYDEGHYGFCSVCRLAIPRGELLMRPYATTCNACRPKRAN